MAIDANIPFSISSLRYELGARRIGLTTLLEMQLVEYFIPKEIRYRPALDGRWYLLQTNKQSLKSLNDYNVSRIMLMNLGSISSNYAI